MNTIKRFWALCLDTHMKLALYKYAIIIIIIFRFDFVFVKPRAVPPIFCLNLQTVYYNGHPRNFADELPGVLTGDWGINLQSTGLLSRKGYWSYRLQCQH